MGWHYYTVLIWLWSGAIWAYPTPVDFSGKISRWDISLDNNRAITYEVRSDSSYDESYFGTLVDEAAALWTQVPSSYVELAAANQNERADITIEFSSSLDGASFSSGFAIFDEFDDEKNPIHCTINILASGSLNSIQKTILHELGHCLGLGHTLVPEAIMSYSLDKNSYQLDTDDRAAVSRIYPADGSEPKLPPGCSTPYWLGKQQSGHFILIALLFIPLIFVRRRRLK